MLAILALRPSLTRRTIGATLSSGALLACWAMGANRTGRARVALLPAVARHAIDAITPGRPCGADWPHLAALALAAGNTCLALRALGANRAEWPLRAWLAQ